MNVQGTGMSGTTVNGYRGQTGTKVLGTGDKQVPRYRVQGIKRYHCTWVRSTKRYQSTGYREKRYILPDQSTGYRL